MSNRKCSLLDFIYFKIQKQQEKIDKMLFILKQNKR